MSAVAAHSLNLPSANGDAVVWPQMRMEIRFLTKKGEQALEIDAKDIHVLDNGFEVKGANIERAGAAFDMLGSR